ncbi:MAG: long-chain fatty acid--CoA ligase [Pseudomonadota bacterium]
MISLHGLIQRAARLNPNGLATRFQDRDRSWSEARDRMAQLGGALSAAGVADGDRVAILSLNSDRYYESIFGISWAGACVVPLNTRWAVAENHYALEDSGTTALLFDDNFAEQAGKLLADLDTLKLAIHIGDGPCPDWAQNYEALIAENAPAEPSSRCDGDMAGIFYTGGTTGFPKGVMQSHGALWASAMGSLPEFHMNRESIYLHVAPMFHVADFAGGMGATLCAASHVILPAFDPGVVLKTWGEQRITHSLMVPSMIKMTLNHPDAASADTSSMQTLTYGASPMPAATLEQFMDTWPTIALVQAYGQTELAPVVTMLSREDHVRGSQRLKSAGRPTAVNEVRIVAEDGSDAPQGTSGEIVVRGPHSMIGYWNKPEETAKALRDGWVYTGDAAYVDEDGFIYIVDRVKDMVVTGGENVFTTEVENAVMTHEAVQDVAVIGVPHEEWGEAVHAIVILREGKTVSEEDLISHCRELIAGYKLPKSIAFRGEPMPLSGAGKVLKTELRKPYWEGHDRQIN